MQAPNLKLKPLSDHRGYPFLGHTNQRPVIIPAKLAKGRWVVAPKRRKEVDQARLETIFDHARADPASSPGQASIPDREKDREKDEKSKPSRLTT